MKAVFCTAYGPPDVLQLREVPTPVPRANEVLIKIHASTVTFGDCELRTLTLPKWTRIPLRLYMGYRKPRNFIPGMELSGVVEAVGENVTSLKKGDAVFCSSGLKMGANAEYICLTDKSAITIKPDQLSFEDAATLIVGGINALHFLRKADIKPGQKVLIIGAGGSIGTYGVQLAKLAGAEVTAVDHASKLDMLINIGADYVIDYTKEDFHARGKKYDVIFDMIYKSSFTKCIDSLTAEGIYLMANTGPLRMIRGALLNRKSSKKTFFKPASETVSDLNYLAELIVNGKIKPVIDRVYPLEELAAAHAYVERSEKKGCVVIRH